MQRDPEPVMMAPPLPERAPGFFLLKGVFVPTLTEFCSQELVWLSRCVTAALCVSVTQQLPAVTL